MKVVVSMALVLAPMVANAQARDTVRVDYPVTKCPSCAAWSVPKKPFRIFGNTYYVGTAELSSILITSPDGNVLIDGALPTSAPQILANIRSLGFRVEDVKLILNSHAHYDHAGGIAALQRATKADLAVTDWSGAVITRGESDERDPQFGLALPFPAATVTRLVEDGDVLSVGNIRLTAHVTAGHTPGGTTWSWISCESGHCLNVVYADSQSPISADGFLFTRNATYPTAEADFAHGLATLESLPCDILLTPHPGASSLFQRADSATLANPALCKEFVVSARKAVAERIARER